MKAINMQLNQVPGSKNFDSVILAKGSNFRFGQCALCPTTKPPGLGLAVERDVALENENGEAAGCCLGTELEVKARGEWKDTVEGKRGECVLIHGLGAVVVTRGFAAQRVAKMK